MDAVILELWVALDARLLSQDVIVLSLEIGDYLLEAKSINELTRGQQAKEEK